MELENNETAAVATTAPSPSNDAEAAATAPRRRGRPRKVRPEGEEAPAPRPRRKKAAEPPADDGQIPDSKSQIPQEQPAPPPASPPPPTPQRDDPIVQAPSAPPPPPTPQRDDPIAQEPPPSALLRDDPIAQEPSPPPPIAQEHGGDGAPAVEQGGGDAAASGEPPLSPREERFARWGRRGRGRFRDRRNRFGRDGWQQDGQPQQPSEDGQQPQQQERPQLPPINLWDIESLSVDEINERAAEFMTPEEIAGTFRKHDVINDFVRAYLRKGGSAMTRGVIEIMNDGFGFLRSEKASYLACPEDVYVAPNYVRRFNLRTGDFVEGPIRDPRERPERGKEKFLALGRIETVNGRPPAEWRRVVQFENLTPIYPTRRIQLERIAPGPEPTDISMRFVDLFAPVGFGQRGLIVAPPRTGKTVLLQKIANSITANHPDAYLIVLLIDERPEEVTDMERNTRAHVLSSTFDEAPERHAQVAEMTIEMAKRKVESGMDVIILLDSITRLARAYNTLAPHSGKILSGGVDANAMFKPKRFFGAARNIEGGGSLTIIATALIETGSRMDEVIFEEFKGTGNMELVLDRQLSDRRIFPAIDVNASGTRKEELICSPPELNLARSLRKMLTDSPNVIDSMDNIIKYMKKVNSNADFIMQKFNH